MCRKMSLAVILKKFLMFGILNFADSHIKDQTTESIRLLNKKILEDPRINFSLLPLADGLSFIRKK